MSFHDGGTITLTGVGQSFDVQLLQLFDITSLRFSNKSIFDVAVEWGSSRKLIAAGTQDIMRAGGPERFIQCVVTSSTTALAISNQLIIEAATQPDVWEGAYPVAISPNVSLQAVNIAAAQSINIAGTPTVQFAAGQTVAFTNTQIAVLNVLGTNLLTTSPISVVQTISAAAGTTTTTNNIALATGTQSIGFIVRFDAGRIVPLNVVITGSQSLTDYFNALTQAVFSQQGGAQWFELAPTDTQVNVTVRAGAGPAAIDLLQSAEVLGLDVHQTFGESWKISRGAVVGAPGEPAPWEMPRAVAANTTAGAAVAVVTGSPGAHVYLFGWVLESDGATAGSVLAVLTEHATGKNLGILSTPGSQNGVITGTHEGVDLGAGNGIDVTLVSGPAGVTVRAAVSYSQV